MPQSPQRTLGAFMLVSVDGYYCDANGDMGFAHKAADDDEWNVFVGRNASGGGALLFGRVTYEMMAAWWPSPMAAQAMPAVAAGMNAAQKIVFSRTLRTADWSHTTLVNDDMVGFVRRLKADPGPDLTLLGSGSIVTQLADAGLLDRIQVVVNPVALGGGKSLFAGLTSRRELRLEDSRTFKNGAVVLWYEVR
ncbi:MAG: dihydrofolate reductase [Gemmatimonadetes bacterium]|nr:dihydrofolate reductase [Gemmatimonadota bacterium]